MGDPCSASVLIDCGNVEVSEFRLEAGLWGLGYSVRRIEPTERWNVYWVVVEDPSAARRGEELDLGFLQEALNSWFERRHSPDITVTRVEE